MRLREFAPAGGGSSGNYFQALASAWYNGVFDTGSLPRGIKTQEDVERLLNRGIVCPDGKTRKLHIDYNSDFDGVEIYSDDYYEYGDHDDTIDSRTGQKWGPYDFMAFSDEDLSEGLNEFAADDGDSGGEDDALRNYARMWWAGDEATQQQIERALARMGWEIGEDEGGYDNGGVFVVRAGDINGNSYQSWAAEDLTEGVAEGSLNEFAPGGNSASSYYAVTANFVNEFTQQKQEEIQDLIDAGWTKQDLAQAGTQEGAAADIAHLEQVRDGFLKGLKPGFDAYLQGDTQMKDQLGEYWIDNDLPLNQDWEKIYGEPWGDDGEFDEGVAEGSEEYCDACDRVITKKPHVCPGSQGVAEGSEKHECPECDGSGYVQWHGSDTECPKCDGTGHLDDEQGVAEGTDKYAELSKKIRDLAQAGKEGEANKLRYELNRLLMLDRDKKRRQERGVAEGSDSWGPQGRFVGDTGPTQVSTTVPRVQLRIGDRVVYKPTEQRATIEALSKDGTKARIHIPSPMGGKIFNCQVADLKALGALKEKSTSQAQFRTMAAAAHNPKFARKVGIKQSVAREFNKADRGQSYKSLPKKAN